ncbi:MAG: SOS response-associated peptidase [Cyanosarcina radialis HA8281-LM2]|jgi:putative SOS response-associated peptidase YedK|nr:SOS response-associated peptidase [Cyanosarcina radialis HA8281-LM2]
MCGRFTQSHDSEAIAQAFDLKDVPELSPRYNVAPTQMVGTVIKPEESEKRQFKMLYWGLIPSWSKDKKMGAKLINARAETVAEKPSFRSAFKRRRCLVVADGFYEWQHLAGKKQPFYIHLPDKQPFGLAGLWEHWESAEGEIIESCTIITTAANDLMQPIHDRMPVILHPQDYDLWLDPGVQKPELLQPLLSAYPAEQMAAYPVRTLVNKTTHDSPELIETAA